MNITSGTTTLNIVLSSIRPLLEDSIEYKNYQLSVAKQKIVDGFYEKLLVSPLIFYVPKNTIVENKINDNFEKYAEEIFYIEQIYELLLCENLSSLEQRKFNIKWIICEMNLNVKKTKPFHDIAFLDYYLAKEKGKENTSGRLDYNLMDSLFLKRFKKSDLKSFLKTPRKYFYAAIFKVVTADKKGNYEKQELKYFDTANSIEVTEKAKTLKYNYHCPICDSQHLVYLKGHQNNNVEKYIQFNGKHVEFLCDHKGTDYEHIVRFSFDAIKKSFVLKTDEQYNQAFLYLFHLGKYNAGKIDIYKNKNEVISIDVENFHKLRSKND